LAGLIVLIILAFLLTALAALLPPLALLLTGLLTHLLLVLLTRTLLTLIALVCHVDFLCWREPRLQNQQVEPPVPASCRDLEENVGTIPSLSACRHPVRVGTKAQSSPFHDLQANDRAVSWNAPSFPAALKPWAAA
jgi:hypothetical protein